MNGSAREWTVADLEAYHDDELDPERRETLTGVLRQDAALRAELAVIRRVDGLARQALLGPAQMPVRARPGRRWPRRPALPLAMAAGLALAVGWVWHVASSRPPAASGGDVAVGSRRVVAEAEYQAIRVVFSLPIREGHLGSAERLAAQGARPGASETEPTARATRPLAIRLDRLLRAGQVDEAVALLTDAAVEERQAGYWQMAKVLRSALTANQVLDRLPPREQLLACRRWARDPHLRPVVFSRLRDLKQDPDLSNAVLVAAAGMLEDPALRAWVQSYRLVAPGS